MKLVYVADNRCRTNFGCRGTSIALSQLIMKEHNIVGTVTGAYTHEGGGPIFFVPGLSAWAYSFLVRVPGWRFFRKVWCRWINRGGRSRYRFFDFVTKSSERSIENFKRCLVANSHLEEFDLRKYDYDGIVINGEGSMIMTNPPRRDSLVFLMFMEWAKSMGKRVYLVNAMFSDCPSTGTNKDTKRTMHQALKKCDAVAARDPVSLEYLSENFPDVDAEYIPDALFTWQRYIEQVLPIENGRSVLPFGQEADADFDRFDFSKPYICVSGSSSAAWDQKAAYLSYRNLVQRLIREFDYPVYLVQVCDGDQFLVEVGRDLNVPCLQVRMPVLAGAKILSEAALYISGRFHPSIMASLGGTPCVFFGSNSHKTWSIQKMLEYDEVVEFPAFPREENLCAIISLAKKKLDQGESLRESIDAVVSRRAFDAHRLFELFRG